MKFNASRAKVARKTAFLGVVILAWGVLATGCRGYFSEKPPLDLVPNLDVQPKQRAQSTSRLPPAGVVAQNNDEEDVYTDSARLMYGINIAGDYLPPDDVTTHAEASIDQTPLPFGITYLERIPVAVDKELVMRGMERFNIYCSVCHAKTGTGDSIIMRRGVGLPRPSDLSAETIRSMRDGELFNVITFGRRNMRGYQVQVPVADRWAIVSYVRALQYARTASLADVPSAQRQALVEEIRLEQAALEEEEGAAALEEEEGAAALE